MQKKEIEWKLPATCETTRRASFIKVAKSATRSGALGLGSTVLVKSFLSSNTAAKKTTKKSGMFYNKGYKNYAYDDFRCALYAYKSSLHDTLTNVK